MTTTAGRLYEIKDLCLTPGEVRVAWVDAMLLLAYNKEQILTETKQVLLDVLDLLEQTEEEETILEALKPFERNEG